jgi:nitroimidazol reductase NimA-like FMN-containing flavoprotein (pyridoxamine 5'-phosphate oxidase superfamily)
MNHNEYHEASEYWNMKDAESVKMERSELLRISEDYIQSNNTCALATGSGNFVRCTPIEYSYVGGAFWMFSEGGQKFAALENNHNVCLAIYDKYDGFEKLKGMQVTGTAEIIEPFSEEYIMMAEYKKISIDALKKLPHPMNLIRIFPTRIDFLNSEFKKEGCASRQFTEF